MAGLGIDPVSLGIGGVQTVAKLGLAAYQAYKASKLRFQDTTTPEQREMLAIARQRAASLNTPGQAVLEGRLAQGQENAVQSARLGASSGTDYLAAAASAANTRANGEAQLGIQREQYGAHAQDGLQQQLGLQAQQRARDLNTYNTTKAALTSSAIQNASNAVDAGSAYVAYGANKTADAAQAAALAATGATPAASAALPDQPSYGIRGLRLPGYAPGLGGGRYASSRNRFGLPY